MFKIIFLITFLNHWLLYISSMLKERHKKCQKQQVIKFSTLVYVYLFHFLKMHHYCNLLQNLQVDWSKETFYYLLNQSVTV